MGKKTNVKNTLHMPDVFALDERGINRLDLRNMLFREIVSNLLLHREYASTFSSKLLIFSDRVITENRTKPMQVGNVTLDTLETHTKNPLTTKVFREMKWAEELGSGKKNIKKYAPLYYDKYEIEIQNSERFVFSITYRDVASVSFEKQLKTTQENAEKAQETTQENARTTQETTQEKILTEIEKNPTITRNELAIHIGISSDGVKYHLNKMTKEGIIKHEGSTKTGQWIILKNNNPIHH